MNNFVSIAEADTSPIFKSTHGKQSKTTSSPGLCPLGLDTKTCAKVLLITKTLLDNPKSYNVVVNSTNTHPHSLWNVCPPGSEQLECFKKYVSKLLWQDSGMSNMDPQRTKHIANEVALIEELLLLDMRELHEKIRNMDVTEHSSDHSRHDGKDAKDDPHAEKRPLLSWQLCPDSVNRIDCFENYMAMWLSMVGDEHGGKRTTYLPGKKRSSTSMDTGRTLCRKGEDTINCISRIVKQSPPNSHTKHLTIHNQNIQVDQKNDETRKSRELKECAGFGSTYACFDNYLHVLIEMHNQGARHAGKKHFVGRDLESIEHTVTRVARNAMPDCKGFKDRVTCFESYLMAYTTLHGNDQNEKKLKVKQFIGRDLERVGRNVDNANTNTYANKRTRTIPGCETFPDTKSCFETYLKLYAQAGTSVSGGPKLKHFIGRQLKQDDLDSSNVDGIHGEIKATKTKTNFDINLKYKHTCAPGMSTFNCLKRILHNQQNV